MESSVAQSGNTVNYLYIGKRFTPKTTLPILMNWATYDSRVKMIFFIPAGKLCIPAPLTRIRSDALQVAPSSA